MIPTGMPAKRASRRFHFKKLFSDNFDIFLTNTPFFPLIFSSNENFCKNFPYFDMWKVHKIIR